MKHTHILCSAVLISSFASFTSPLSAQEEKAPVGVALSTQAAPATAVDAKSKAIYDRDRRFAKLVDKTVPLLRMCSAEEVAGTFLYLASNDAAYITGTSVVIDGGATLVRRE